MTALTEVAGDEGTSVPVSIKLVQASGPNIGSPIPGKNIHFSIANAELGVVATDPSGIAQYDYVADITDDGENMDIAYVGD